MRLKLKRHYRLIVLLILFSSILCLGFGNQRIMAYSKPGSLQVESLAYPNDITSTVNLFDNSVVHSIQILISDADYQQMITTYQQAGEKEYYQADVIIDGIRINNVGIRLKGNASLRTALGNKGNMRMGFNPNQNPDDPNLLPFDPGEITNPEEREGWQDFQRPDRGNMMPPIEGDFPDIDNPPPQPGRGIPGQPA